jgi:hypothetical protein
MTTKRIFVAVAIAGAVAAGGLVARAAVRGKTASLTVNDIVARNVAARGGPDALRKVETMVWTGHIESAHAAVPSMPFTLEQQRPNKTRLEIDVQVARNVRVFDGVHGWKARAPRSGRPEVQPFNPVELAYAHSSPGFDGPLFGRPGLSSVTLEGVEEIGERKAYHLKVNLAKGTEEHVWIDTETFLELRYDRMGVGEGAGSEQRRVSAFYGDYRSVDGIQIPFLIQTGVGSAMAPDSMRIQRVALNAPLDDAAFRNPGEPQVRRHGLPGFPARAPAAARTSAARGIPPR